MINFLEPHYLEGGNRRQREVYAIVSGLKIMEVLKPYTPVIAGTIPPQEQDGFVHMIVEYRILQMCNDEFREKVRQLKSKGLGTEPAFARLLGIDTDPYEALHGFKDLDDEKLMARIPEKHRRRQRE